MYYNVYRMTAAMNPANSPKSTPCIYINILPSLIVKILLALSVTLPVSLHAETIPVNSASEEFELDLGPQGKDLNRDLYGYGSLSNQENIRAGEWGAWELVYHVRRLVESDIRYA